MVLTTIQKPLLGGKALTFEQFRERHAQWYLQFDPNEPIFSIPIPVKNIKNPPIPNGLIPFSNDEHAYTTWCDEKGIIGVHRSRLVKWEVIQSHLPLPDANQTRRLKNHERIDSDGDIFAKKYEVLRLQQLSVVGYLLSEPMFLQEQERVRSALLRDLPHFCSSIVLVGSSLRFPHPSNGDVLKTSTIELCEKLFLKWGLRELASWDLPVPDRPLIPDLVPPNIPDIRPASVKIRLPISTSLSDAKSLLEDIERMQQHEAKALGLPPYFASLKHTSQYRKMALITHLERSVCQRHHGRLPRGKADAFFELVERVHEIPIDEVIKFRSWLSKCRNGRRDAIPQLRKL